MLLIDALIEATDTLAVAEKTFRHTDYGIDGDCVCEPALIECMAQTMAAYQGQKALERNIPPQPGLLVGVRDARIESAVPCDEYLQIRVEITHRVGDFAVASCRISRDDDVVASATLKFHVPGFSS